MPLNIPLNGGGTPITKATVAQTGVQMQMPFWIGETPQKLWLLPLEPLVAVRGRNVITRRTIAKRKKKDSKTKEGFGSIKELWATDDYEVIITGLLRDHTNPNVLPSEMITRLDGLATLGKPLYVRCALLEALGIGQIAVDGWEFEPTPGIEDQFFSLRGFSDQNFNLLIEK